MGALLASKMGRIRSIISGSLIIKDLNINMYGLSVDKLMYFTNPISRDFDTFKSSTVQDHVFNEGRKVDLREQSVQNLDTFNS